MAAGQWPELMHCRHDHVRCLLVPPRVLTLGSFVKQQGVQDSQLRLPAVHCSALARY